MATNSLTVLKATIPWHVAAAFITAAIALPIGLIFAGLFIEDPTGAWPHIVETNLSRYLWTSTGLLGGVLAVGLLIGIGCSWLTATCIFPGSRMFRWALALPLAIPTYVLAYAWTDVLDYSGPIQGWLHSREISFESWTWLPGSRSLPTAIMVLGLGLYPYIYLTLWPHFRQQSKKQIEAVRSLGGSTTQAFWRIILPTSRPLIAASATLVGLETLAEYGAVDHFGLNTFTTGIYRTWTGERSFPAATKLAAILVLGIIIILGLEKLSRRKGVALRNKNQTAQTPPQWRLHGWRAWSATIACCVPLLLGFLIPLSRLSYLAYHAVMQGKTPTALWQATGTSVVLALIGATLIVVSTLLLSYARRLAPTMAANIGITVARFGYAIPGSVLAVAILAPFAWMDNNWLTPAWLCLTGNEWRLPLSGTAFILLYAYLVRFTTIGLTAIDGKLHMLPQHLDESAKSLGANTTRILTRVHFPLIQRSILMALLLVLVEILKELPATMMLQPWGIKTLAVSLHQEVQQESLSGAATPALLLIAVGLLAIWLTTRIHLRQDTPR